jgi:DNA-binding transcriptional LysR family regulator
MKQRGNPRLWKVSDGGEECTISVDGMFQTNLESAIRIAALQGSGVARLPLYSVANELKSGALVSLFGGGITLDRTIKAFYPRSRYVPKKVYEFLSIMEGRLNTSSQ